MASLYKPKGSSYYWIAYYKDKTLYRRSLKTKDLKVARFHKNETENELAKGLSPLPPSDLIARDCLEEYIKYALSRKITKKAIKNVETHRTWIRSFLKHAGTSKLYNIKPRDIEKFLQYRKETDKVGFDTLNHIITAMRTWLNWSMRRGYVAENAANKVDKYKLPKNPPRFFSVEEISRLLQAAKNNHIHPMVATALYTGIRANELINLEWEDFDFNREVLTISNKIDFQTKSRKFRTIPLNSRLITILSPLRQQKGLCFTNKGKRLFAARRRAFLTTLKEAGIKRNKKEGWHTLRHTFASRLVQEGVSIFKVSKWLGHSSVNTTMIYAHLAPVQDEDINRI